MSNESARLKQRFLEAIQAWLVPPASRKPFQDHWLGPNCTFLTCARDPKFHFDDEVSDWLRKLDEHDHVISAKAYYKPLKSEKMIHQAAMLMTGLTSAVSS
jgi:hypothetical protein